MRLTNTESGVRVARSVAAGAVAFAAVVGVPGAGDPFQPIRGLVVATAAAALLSTSSRSRAQHGTRTAALVALGFIAWMALSAAVNGWASGVFGVHGRFQALVALGIVAVAGWAGATAADRVRSVGWALVGSLSVVSAVVIGQVLVGAEPVATMGNSVLAGSWLALATTGAAALGRVERGPMRAVAWSVAAVGGLALGLTGSRGALLGALAGLGVVAVAGRAARTRWAVLALTAALLAGAAAGGTLGRLTPTELTGGSVASRLEIWKVGGAMVLDRPLIGSGPGRFLFAFPGYETEAHARAEGADVRPDQAHSLLLQTAVEGGFPALALGVGLLAVVAASIRRGLTRGAPAALLGAAVLAAYVVQGLWGIATIETDALAWLLGGMALAASQPTSDDTGHDVRGGRSRRWEALGVALPAAALAASCAWYLWADITFGRGLEAYAQGRFDQAAALSRTAERLNPLVDVYRIGRADAGSVLAVTQGASLEGALGSLERGLALEPYSYDLALARARALELSGADPGVTAEAYLSAVALYPLGVTVRVEAADALLAAGRESEALGMARGVLESSPGEPGALAVVRDAEGG